MIAPIGYPFAIGFPQVKISGSSLVCSKAQKLCPLLPKPV